MKKFIIWHNVNGSVSNPEHTHYEYSVGETINVNSSEVYKCIKKEFVDGELIHHFKQGKRIYQFNY